MGGWSRIPLSMLGANVRCQTYPTLAQSQVLGPLSTRRVCDWRLPGCVNFPSLPVGPKCGQGDPKSQKEPPGEKVRCGVGGSPLGPKAEGHRDLGGALQPCCPEQIDSLSYLQTARRVGLSVCGRASFLHPFWCKVIS